MGVGEAAGMSPQRVGTSGRDMLRCMGGGQSPMAGYNVSTAEIHSQLGLASYSK